MSNLNLDEPVGKYLIRSYEPGYLKINEQTYQQSLIITPDQIYTDWAPQRIEDLSATYLNLPFAQKPNILLIGTGETHHIINIELYGELLNQGIGVEVMSTRAACRTFNALVSEHRNVAAALIIR